ncbi:MAG: ribosome maturation factor RimM [Gammaproteobacteria bacterium]|nr:ribosome maturation factor RimM [Gammaproteobacteria bacterium]
MTASAERTVVVGRVTGVFGVKGWVRVHSFTDPRDGILGYHPWLIGDERQSAHRVVDGAVHGNGIIARLDGIADRDAARALVGSTISVWRRQLGATRPDEFFWADLIGLTVVNEEGAILGTVKDLLATGANDVLVIEGERRRLVPFIPGQVVRRVDLEGRQIRVDWNEEY